MILVTAVVMSALKKYVTATYCIATAIVTLTVLSGPFAHIIMMGLFSLTLFVLLIDRSLGSSILSEALADLAQQKSAEVSDTCKRS